MLMILSHERFKKYDEKKRWLKIFKLFFKRSHIILDGAKILLFCFRGPGVKNSIFNINNFCDSFFRELFPFFSKTYKFALSVGGLQIKDVLSFQFADG